MHGGHTHSAGRPTQRREQGPGSASSKCSESDGDAARTPQPHPRVTRVTCEREGEAEGPQRSEDRTGARAGAEVGGRPGESKRLKEKQ
jgi:hypothetical protein